MTNRDFDQSDSEVLAEFAKDVIVIDKEDEGNGVLIKYVGEHYSHKTTFFFPWLMQSGYWQIQSLLDAVREKGLEDCFMDELTERLGYEKETGSWIEPEYSSDYIELVSAPPEAICSAILSLEGE
jgi:hypothetical protein